MTPDRAAPLTEDERAALEDALGGPLWAGHGVRETVELLLAARVAQARREAWDEGWDERDNYCSEPYSPHRVNPTRGA
jgi:hypothetical protein